MESAGVQFDPILDQMKEYIIRLVRHFQPHLISSANWYPAGPKGFFSMFRFDFMLDPNLQPWLIEINQSPNLASDATPDLKNMFQRIAFSLLNLNGYGYGQIRHPMNPPDQMDVIAHYNDVDIGWRICSKCENTCDAECLICRHCRTPEQSRMLQVHPPLDTCMCFLLRPLPELSPSCSLLVCLLVMIGCCFANLSRGRACACRS